VPGATIALENLATSASRTAVSGNRGGYVILGLTPGTYRLTVSKEGFARYVNEELALTVGQLAKFNVNLRVQAVRSVVEVTEAPELIGNQSHRRYGNGGLAPNHQSPH